MRTCLLATTLGACLLAATGCGITTDPNRTNPKIEAGAGGTGAGLPREGMGEEVRGMGAIAGPGPNGEATSMGGTTGTVAAIMANPPASKQLPTPGGPAPTTGAAPVRP